jgi:hypothetical protein
MRIFKNKIITLLGAAAAIALAGACAKESSESTNGDNKIYFDAWISEHYPAATPTELGVYIIEDHPGTGEAIADDDNYLFIKYTATSLDGTIESSTEENLAQQLGTYSKGNYYGPAVVLKSKWLTQAGILDILDGMRVGGVRKAVVPGWLNVTLEDSEDYSTAEEYLKHKSGSNAIYTIELIDKTDDIYEWEVDSLERYTARVMNGVDSTFYGYYYQQLKAPSDTTTFPTDTTFYINYTGRLLNGQVFDTTIEDTAKFYGIYSSSKTYEPTYVKMSEDYTEITIGGSSTSDGSTTIDGFAYCLSKMKAYEKGVCAFYSYLGYGYSGSGDAIPAYAPLSFEIEIVDYDE